MSEYIYDEILLSDHVVWIKPKFLEHAWKKLSH
jgi:hypothetical protein